MPTLLQINVSSNLGSTGKITEQIGLLAKSKKWKCYLAHGSRYVNDSQLNTYQIGNILIELVHGGIYSFLLDRNGLGSTLATKKFIDIIENKIRPDIVHLHNIHGYYINYKLLFEYLKKKGIPVVWTLHDCWSFTGHCSHFDFQGCKLWKTHCHDCPLLHTYPKSLFIDNSQSNYELKKRLFTSLGDNLTLVPVSKWLEKLLKESFFKKTKISTIHNGIDLEAFSTNIDLTIKNKYNLDNKKVLLGVAAPWTARKGLYDFYKLNQILPDDYKIVLVGLSKRQIESLPSNIVGIERTKDISELTALYSLADAFINTTYEDNYPTVNLEAIACGTPVITYDTGGSAESLSIDTGIIVEQGNINALVNAIYSLCKKDRNLTRILCRNYAVQNFDRNQCFNKYLDMYHQILEK